MLSTLEWAQAHNESVDYILPAMEWFKDSYPRSAREIAARAIILQNVVDVAYVSQNADLADALKPEEIVT